jgi:hypothetical protein
MSLAIPNVLHKGNIMWWIRKALARGHHQNTGPTQSRANPSPPSDNSLPEGLRVGGICANHDEHTKWNTLEGPKGSQIALSNLLCRMGVQPHGNLTFISQMDYQSRKPDTPVNLCNIMAQYIKLQSLLLPSVCSCLSWG